MSHYSLFALGVMYEIPAILSRRRPPRRCGYVIDNRETIAYYENAGYLARFWVAIEDSEG